MSKPTWSFGFRTVDLNMVSSHGFKYPEKGLATCDDWIDEDDCGHGLHYLKDFEGDYFLTEVGSLPAARCQLLKVNHKYKGKNNIRSIDGGAKYKSHQVQVLGTFLSLKDMKKFLEKYRTTRTQYKKEILKKIDELIDDNEEGVVVKDGEYICLDNEEKTIALDGGTAIWNRNELDPYSKVFYLLSNKSKAVVIAHSECYPVDLSKLAINKSYQLHYNKFTNNYEAI